VSVAATPSPLPPEPGSTRAPVAPAAPTAWICTLETVSGIVHVEQPAVVNEVLAVPSARALGDAPSPAQMNTSMSASGTASRRQAAERLPPGPLSACQRWESGRVVLMVPLAPLLLQRICAAVMHHNITV